MLLLIKVLCCLMHVVVGKNYMLWVMYVVSCLWYVVSCLWYVVTCIFLRYVVVTKSCMLLVIKVVSCMLFKLCCSWPVQHISRPKKKFKIRHFLYSKNIFFLN